MWILRLLRHSSQILILSLFVGQHPLIAAETPNAETLMAKLKLDHQAAEQLIQGQLVSFDLSEHGETELSAGVAAYLPASPDKIITLIRDGKLASIETDIVAIESMPDNVTTEAFKKFVFTEKQVEEAERFLAAKAGDYFNLSASELVMIRAVNADSKKPTDLATEIYRRIMLKRWEAYRKSGLKGIANYERDGDAAGPATELREMTESNKLLALYFPVLFGVWLNYPANMPDNAEEQFLWMNLIVEKRPTPVLVHRVILTTQQGSVILSRQYYVGHSYNTSQLTIGCLPFQDGAFLFYGSRTSTDQVAGLASSLKHSIGREQLRGEMIERIKKLKQLI